MGAIIETRGTSACASRAAARVFFLHAHHMLDQVRDGVDSVDRDCA
jgi:hypothetical protein